MRKNIKLDEAKYGNINCYEFWIKDSLACMVVSCAQRDSNDWKLVSSCVVADYDICMLYIFLMEKENTHMQSKKGKLKTSCHVSVKIIERVVQNSLPFF